jgi:hypothetical protein
MFEWVRDRKLVPQSTVLIFPLLQKNSESCKMGFRDRSPPSMQHGTTLVCILFPMTDGDAFPLLTWLYLIIMLGIPKIEVLHLEFNNFSGRMACNHIYTLYDTVPLDRLEIYVDCMTTANPWHQCDCCPYCCNGISSCQVHRKSKHLIWCMSTGVSS